MPSETAPEADELVAAIREQMTPAQESQRVPKPKRLNVDVDPDFYDQVKAKADRQGKSVSEVVRELLRIYLST